MPEVRVEIDRRILGTVCLVPAVVGLVPAVLDLRAGAIASAIGFLAMIVASLATGALLRRAPPVREHDTGRLLATMALVWLLVPCLGCAPFAAVWWGAPDRATPLADALFESFSGFTSCGLTMARDASALSPGLQLFRSLSQWIGGVGVAALMLIAMNPFQDGRSVLTLEVGGAFTRRARDVARWIWGAYAVLTVAAFGALCLAGEPPWRAFNHALTSVSTGGFTITADSAASSSRGVQAILAAFMVLGAISFANLRRAAIERDPRATDRQVGLWLALLAVACLGAAGAHDGPAGDAVFQALSALATGGFQSAPVDGWSGGVLTLLVVCMFVGGMSGSTAGGLKVQRVSRIARAAIWRMRRASLGDDGERVVVVERQRLTETDARLDAEAAATLAFVWVLVVLASVAIVAPLEAGRADFGAVVFEVVSATSSVGLTAGVAGPEAALGTKAVLVALMWLGRLEIFAGLILVGRVLGRRG